MKRFVVLTAKILCGWVALLLVVLMTAWMVLNSASGQQRLLRFAVNLLQDKLQTRVMIDSVNVDFQAFHVHLMGLDVEDLQQRKLLQADRLEVSLDLRKLLMKKIEVESAELSGLSVNLSQPKDSAANYQFVIDAFQRDKKNENDNEDGKKKAKPQLAFDIHRIRLSDAKVVYNGFTRKGFLQTTTFRLSELEMNKQAGKHKVVIDSLRFTTDNHQPRKNAGRPKRGFFDVGHLDVSAHLELTVHHIGNDSVSLSLTQCVANDPMTGIAVTDLRFDAGINKTAAHLRDVTLQHLNTTLRFDSALVTLPSKKQGRALAYQTSAITGRTLLKDIARPFAPALAKFSIPLCFKVVLSGTDTTMHFRNIHVNTADQKLKIDARGDISHLKEKERLFIRFRVDKMRTDAVTAKTIIDQFVVKKFMMRQLNNLGTISYAGSFDILYKMEKFRGKIGTSAGEMDFQLTLNERTKYLTGSVSTNEFRLGQVIEMKDIGDVGCNAQFTFDYSKPRTAQVRRLRGGNLPIGEVTVNDVTTSYKKIKFKNVSATITSDGVEAQGQIMMRKKLADILCRFTFDSTDSINKMKIKPGVRFRRQRKHDRMKAALENNGFKMPVMDVT